MKNILVTIDGPAASGKGKIANYLSKKWKLKHLDSGVLYRKLALGIIDEKINFNLDKELKIFIKNYKFNSFKSQKKLRTEKVSKIASKIAVHKFVRNHVNLFQKKFVGRFIKNHGFVIDGRDIGSVVFKNADLKLYIDVSLINRAKRRYKQLIDTNEKSIYAQILKEIKLRDKKDKSRKISPLVVPNGAIVIDNNGKFTQTTKIINTLISKL